MNFYSGKCRSWFPSVVDIFFITLFLSLLGIGGKLLLRDGDTGLHVRAGEVILSRHTFLKEDLFSFITPPVRRVAHQWLSQVLMALIHQRSGLTGVVIFYAFLIALTYAVLFQWLLKESCLFIAAGVLFFTLFCSSVHWLARPHIISLLFLVLFYRILDIYQREHQDRLGILPFLMILWVNLHGAFIMGFIFLSIYLGGNGVWMLAGKGGKKVLFTNKVKRISFVFFVCLAVSGINPEGWWLLSFPFKIFSQKVILENIGEYLSPDFHNMKAFAFFLLFVFAVFAFSRVSVNLIEACLLLTTLYLALYSVRNVPIFCMVSAPVTARYADLFFKEQAGRFPLWHRLSYRVDMMERKALGCWGSLAGVLLAVILVYQGRLQYRFDEKTAPLSAIEFLRREHIQGHGFNDYEFGDHIVYRAWPEYKVFVHGIMDFIDASPGRSGSNFQDYLKVSKIKPGWEEVFKKYDMTWAFLCANSPLSLFLIIQKDWKLIYADQTADVFVKDIPQNRRLIEKYPQVRLVPGD